MKIVSFVQVNFQQGPRELNAHYLPYSAGVVLSYALSKLTNWQVGELVWRRDPIEATAQKLKNSDIVGFSTYVWNRQYNYALAKRVKELNPNCTIVMGGPEIAITDTKLFQKYPWMDLEVKMEGEITFARILENHSSAYSLIPGILINQNGTVLDTGDAERIGELDHIPSPYLTGLFDRIMQENPEVIWNATLETNRGCPYQCTFCDWGSLTYNKVKKFGLERVFAELDWIGERCGFVTITDANFGMFIERDNLIIDRLIEVQHRWNKLTNFSLTWAKNQKNEVVDMVRKLVDKSLVSSQGLTVSVQSMNETVLKTIKRANLEQHKIDEIFELCDRYNIPVHTELILGLPGDTAESWRENFWKLFRAGNHTGLSILHAQLLENAEMNLLQRKLYKLESVPMYDYMSGSYSNGEIDESIDVVIATKHMPRDVMLDIMVWNSFIQTFHVNGLSNYIARYMAKTGVDYSEFYDNLYSWLQQDSWWAAQFAETRRCYQEWIVHGRVQHPGIGNIEIPGWNMHNRITLVLHSENRINNVYQVLTNYIKSHYSVTVLDELIQFQRATVIDHASLSCMPQRINFDCDFLGYIQDNKSLYQPTCYEFSTNEDKTMSPQMFLENFYFGRKRNFGKAKIDRV